MKLAEDRIDAVEERNESLETFVAENNYKNIFAFGDGAERHDFNSNVAKSMSVLVTGSLD